MVRVVQSPRLSWSSLPPRARIAATLGLGQVAGRGGLAVGLLLLVRALSPADFGDLALLLALTAILVTVSDAGFGRLIVRDVARSQVDPASMARALLKVRLIGVAVVAVIALTLFLVVPNPFGIVTIALAVTYLASEAIAFGFESAAVGAERPWRFVLAQALFGVTLLGGLAALVATDRATLPSAVGMLVLASLLKVTGHLASWRSRAGRRAARPLPRRPARELYRVALPFLGLTLLATIYYRIGVIVLYWIRGAEETASYAAALRVVDIAALLAGLVFSAISPGLSRAHRDRPKDVWVIWKRAMKVCALAVIPIALVLFLVAHPLCGLLFGSAYQDSTGEDLQWLVPGIALMVPQAVGAAVVFMADEHRSVLGLTAMNVTFCVVASAWLSNGFGSAGAAGALSAAELLSFVTFAVLIRHRYAR